MPNNNFYPSINSLINVDSIPSELGFTTAFLDTVFYQNLRVQRSRYGEQASYYIEIISDSLRLPLGDNGFELLVNPNSNSESVIPVELFYQWEIIKYISDFDITSFTFDNTAYYKLLLSILRVNPAELLSNAIDIFIQVGPGQNKIERFIDAYNNSGSNNLQPTTDFQNLINQLSALEIDIEDLIYNFFVENTDNALQSLEILFSRLLGLFSLNTLKDLIIPKFNLSIAALQLALTFPRTWLIPVDANGDIIDDESKSMLTYNVGGLKFDSNGGFEFIEADNFDLTPSQIGNTGLLIDVSGVKLDLKSDENIPEADLDGRDNNFKGVYAEYASITLPKKWFKQDTGQTLAVSGQNLLIGTGGISGTIALRATYATNAQGEVTNYYQNYFDIEYPVTVLNNGTPQVIASYSALLTYINSLPKPNDLKFKYPFSVTPNQTGNIVIFDTENQYNTFINALSTNQFMWFNLGSNESKSWRLGFENFNITFKQGQIVASHLHARLELKKFKKPGETQTALIDLVGEWESQENFKLAASFLPDGLPLNLFDLITITFQGAEIGSDNGDFFIGADTKISFPEGSLANSLFNDQVIDLPALRFYFDGRFEIVGGNAFIPVNFTLPIGPIDMSVTGIHLGSIQREHNGKMRKYNYLGFDGGMSINPIGVDIRGKGVKYFYTTDNDEHPDNGSDSYFHISTLELDLIIPGTVSPSAAVAIIKGSLTIPEPGVSSEFSGKISVQLPQASIYGEAAMRLNPKYPSYLIDASVEFPVPIPLGAVGIFGFRGLLGYRYVAEKKAIGMTEDNTWYEYYMAPHRGINYEKFSGPDDTGDYDSAFSVGLGASIATMDGGGRTASLRAMILLSLPSMFAVDAGLTILSERLGMAEDDPSLPPFYAFVIIGDDSLEFGAGANFKLNKSQGAFIDIQAQIEAGFFFKNQRPWYINFGTREKPITATVFKDVLNLRAMSYLMLSASGIEAGARVDFDIDLIIAKLWASLEVGGNISFERPQVGGYIKAEGGVHVDFWIFDITATVNAYMSVEIPKPFLIFAEIKLRLCGRLKLGFIKITLCIPFSIVLKWQKNNTVDYTAIPPLTYLALNDPDYAKAIQTSNFAKGVHMMTFETFDLNFLGVGIIPDANNINKIIPLDTYIDFKLEKGLNPSAVSSKIGGHTGGANNFIDLIPPKQIQPGGHTLKQVKHKYSIENLEIRAWHEQQQVWVDYHPFKAILPDEDVDHLKIGFWQKNSTNGQYDTIRLLATNPFAFLDGAEPGWFIPEQYGITPSSLFCTIEKEEKICVDVLNMPLGKIYYPLSQYIAHYINGIYFGIKGDFATGGVEDSPNLATQDTIIVSDVQNSYNYAKSLVFNNYNTMTIILPETSVRVELRLSSFSQGVTIKYFRAGAVSNSLFQAYELIEEVYKTNSQLLSPVIFDNEQSHNNLRNVLKIELIPDYPYVEELTALEDQLAELIYFAEVASEGVTTNTIPPEDLPLYNQLLADIQYLKSLGCNSPEGEPCQTDAVLCELYETLLSLFNDCFATLTPSSVFNYCNKLGCFNEFMSEITRFDIIHPQYQLIQQYIHHEFIEYSDRLNQLSQWCSKTDESNNTVFAYYSAFREVARTIINIIDDMGDCNCNGDEQKICTTSIQSVCYLSLQKFEYNQTIPSQESVQADTQAMIEGLEATAQPVWRPNTKYYIKFSLKDEVDNGHHTPGDYDYYYGFRTVGPVGHFDKYPGAYTIPVGESADEYPLTSLRKYIDYNRSYPNADGSLLQAKPLFYGNEQCTINIFLAKPFAYHLLNNWPDYNQLGEIKGAMHLAIKDPITDVIIPYPLPQDWELSETVPETVGNGENGISWVSDDNPDIPLPLNIQILNEYINLVNANNDTIQCEIELGDPIKPASNIYSVTLANLRPSKLYTALVYNAFDENMDGFISTQLNPDGSIKYDENQKVHEFVFQTSRYRNFREQVQSFILKETDEQGNIINQKQAVFELELSLSPSQIQNMYALVSANSNTETNAMATQFYHEYDRVIEGVLALQPTDPPTCTDFIKIKDILSGNTIALILRNPEPFNNPKIPLGNIQDTLQVLSGSTPDSNYKVLFSKDYSQAIIMHTSMAIGQNLKLKFVYKIWNGYQYIVPNIDPATGNIVDTSKESGVVIIDITI